MRHLPLLSLLAALSASTLAPATPVAAQDAQQAQKPQHSGKKEPKRPKLGPGADTNHAATYYLHGVSLIERRPAEAADAFYWASRLDPARAEPLYARYVALLMSDPQRLIHYSRRTKKVMSSREIQEIDSLHLRALALDPFLHKGLDKQLLRTLLTALAEDDMRRGGREITRAELEYWINTSLMRTMDPEMQGWLAYTEGRLPAALEHYAAAIKRARVKAPLHAERARIWVLAGTLDSALADMTQAVAQMRELDDKELVPVYESKAVYEHSIAIIHEKLGNQAAAREAYGRALAEDLSYHPAHARLGFLAFSAGDTATALTELELAVQLAGSEPALRLAYGYALAVANRLDEAAEQLSKAIEAEPHFATPYYLLAHIRDTQGRRPDALELYKAFLARASRAAPQLDDARQRVAELTAG